MCCKTLQTTGTCRAHKELAEQLAEAKRQEVVTRAWAEDVQRDATLQMHTVHAEIKVKACRRLDVCAPEATTVTLHPDQASAKGVHLC